MGEHAKALVLREKVLPLRQAKLGEDHPRTLTSMAALAGRFALQQQQRTTVGERGRADNKKMTEIFAFEKEQKKPPAKVAPAASTPLSFAVK